MNRKVIIDVLDDMMRLELEAEALDVLTERRDQLMHDLQHSCFFRRDLPVGAHRPVHIEATMMRILRRTSRTSR